MPTFETLWNGLHPHLQSLFNADYLAQRKQRIADIHYQTEMMWESYATSISPRSVQHILILEAPPWNADYESMQRINSPVYLFNKEIKKSPLLSRAYNTYRTNSKNSDCNECIRTLASCGFLSFESLPFALPYAGVRGKRGYLALIKASLEMYVKPKLASCGLTYSPDCKVALGFRVHGRAFIAACNGQFQLPYAGVAHIGEESIAYSQNLPSAANMRRVFGLDEGL